MKTKTIASLGGTLAVVAAIGITVAFIHGFGENDADEQKKSGASEQASSSVPQFGQESQKRRYVEAVSSGKEKAISVLEAAIAKAEASRASEALIADLRARLAQRKQELATVSPP